MRTAGPLRQARLYAITNIAMHDALNGIVPRSERYADKGAVNANADLAAAVLTAAHDAMAGADPSAKVSVDAWYKTLIEAERTKRGFDEGVAIGQRAAAAIIAARANDGTLHGGVAAYGRAAGRVTTSSHSHSTRPHSISLERADSRMHRSGELL